MKHTLHYIRPRTTKTEGSWMIIFADLLALLMTFFVMLISMNTVQSAKWNSMVEAFSDAFNPARESVSIETTVSTPTSYEQVDKAAISLDYLSAVFEEAISNNKGVLGLHVSRLEDKVVISLPSHFLFNTDSYDFASSPAKPSLTPAARSLIVNLTSVVEQLANEVAIVGHVSPNYKGSSVWLQSLEFAQTVQQTIQASGYSGVLPVYAMGDSRYESIDETIIPEVRLNISSRVDIEVKEQIRENLVND